MSRFGEYVKMAIQNIRSNKGRSFLTMLGIIIGIASVIMIMSVGAGTTNAMNSELEGIAKGVVDIYSSDDSPEVITEEDLSAIEKISGVHSIMMNKYVSGETVTGKGDFAVNLNGTNQHGRMMTSFNIKEGRYLEEADIVENRNICVISDADAERLFGSSDVVGMDIDTTCSGISKSYLIVGVTETKENSAMIQYTYEGQPITLDIPYSATAEYVEGYDEFYNFTVKVNDNTDPVNISDKIIELLETRHDASGEEYFRVQNYQDTMDSFNMVFNIMTAFISCVAGISLLVGGIGVMNIMLVSVTERTREIGIRKSLGAKTSSITLQFLAESAILTIVGGIIGIVFGLVGAMGICSILSANMGTDVKAGIEISTILGATLFSCLVGLFFGIYPARKAALLSPIEALRRN